MLYRCHDLKIFGYIRGMSSIHEISHNCGSIIHGRLVKIIAKGTSNSTFTLDINSFSSPYIIESSRKVHMKLKEKCSYLLCLKHITLYQINLRIPPLQCGKEKFCLFSLMIYRNSFILWLIVAYSELNGQSEKFMSPPKLTRCMEKLIYHRKNFALFKMH